MSAPRILTAGVTLLALIPVAALPAQETDPADGPTFVAHDVKPVLANQDEVVQLLKRAYPAGYRSTGLDVTAVLWVFVDEEGKVGKSQILKSSGYDVFDGAAMEVAGGMVFAPAQSAGEPVAVWINQAIHFKSAEGGQHLSGPAGIGAEKKRPEEAMKEEKDEP